ncbi:MAG: RidA family protein [Acidimicrobiales bacterium]|jgi:2-iminobutanoate/2-iminopropanoate deaminase
MSVAPRPYSHWRRAGDLVVLSGQLGMHTENGVTKLVEGGTAAELKQALANAEHVLAEAGATMSQVVKATLFILDMKDFGACNEVWLAAFSAPLPTRTAVAVAQLPLGAHAEVELWAFAPEVATS